MSEEDIAELKKGQFSLSVPPRWRKRYPKPIENVSILTSEGKPDISVAFYHDMMSANTEEGQRALDNFKKEVETKSVHLDVQPGMAVYIDNRRALHAGRRI